MGVWSDSIACRWGQRRPFIIGGTSVLLIGLILLSEAQELATFLGTSDRVFALVGVCMILLSMQPLQMGARALIAEQSPPTLVPRTNGWASRWIGLGSVAGYLLGVVNPGGSMKILYGIAASLLALSVLVTCWAISEGPSLGKARPSLTIGKVSPAIRRIFTVQFYNWLAWFPFLSYGSTYVAEGEILGSEAASLSRGSFGMFLFALLAFGFNVLLPQLMSRFDATRASEKMVHRHRPLATLWMSGHLSYSIVMASAFLVAGQGRIIVVALAAFNWSLTQWVPFTLINEHLLEDGLDAGIVTSLHNVAISLPQILSALLTACILWVARLLGATNELEILLSLTAVPSLLAAYYASRIDRVKTEPWFEEHSFDSDFDL